MRGDPRLMPREKSTFSVFTYFNDGIHNQHYEMSNHFEVIKSWFGIDDGSNAKWHKKYQSVNLNVGWNSNTVIRNFAQKFLQNEGFSYLHVDYDEKILHKLPALSLEYLAKYNTEHSGGSVADFYLIFVQKPTTMPSEFSNDSEDEISLKNQVLNYDLIAKRRLLPISQTRLVNFHNQFGFSLIALSKPVLFGDKNKAKFFCSSSFDTYVFNRAYNKLIAFIPAHETIRLNALPLSYKDYENKKFMHFVSENESIINDICMRGLIREIKEKLNLLF